MQNLLEGINFFPHKFPKPQYLGAKYTHRDWIASFIPKNINFILDAFSGSQSISYLFK